MQNALQEKGEDRRGEDRRGENGIIPLSKNLQFYYGRLNIKLLSYVAVPQYPNSISIGAALPLALALRQTTWSAVLQGANELKKKSASKQLLVFKWFSSP